MLHVSDFVQFCSPDLALAEEMFRKEIEDVLGLSAEASIECPFGKARQITLFAAPEDLFRLNREARDRGYETSVSVKDDGMYAEISLSIPRSVFPLPVASLESEAVKQREFREAVFFQTHNGRAFVSGCALFSVSDGLDEEAVAELIKGHWASRYGISVDACVVEWPPQVRWADGMAELDILMEIDAADYPAVRKISQTTGYLDGFQLVRMEA